MRFISSLEANVLRALSKILTDNGIKNQYNSSDGAGVIYLDVNAPAAWFLEPAENEVVLWCRWIGGDWAYSTPSLSDPEFVGKLRKVLATNVEAASKLIYSICGP